jgi:hypothetical protein
MVNTFSICCNIVFNEINITIVIFPLIPRILDSPFSVLQLSLNVTFAAKVQNWTCVDSFSANSNNKFNGSHDRTIYCRPSPSKSRNFELSSVLVGMGYQDSVKRQC